MADDGFREDLIIANDDGYLYHVTQADLKHGRNAKGQSFRVDPTSKCYQKGYGEVLKLLSRGMVVAAVPKPADDERADVTVIMPIMCYVLNIDALKHYNRWEPNLAPPKAKSSEHHRKGEAEA